VRTIDMIDMDEAGFKFKIEAANPNSVRLYHGGDVILRGNTTVIRR